MPAFALKRLAETKRSTRGEMLDGAGAHICWMLERGTGNADHPRIPAGTYEVARKPKGSSHFDDAFSQLIGPTYNGILWLPRVFNRTNIELHTANYVSELLGCLATGEVVTTNGGTDFMIPGGLSKPAYKRLYGLMSPAIDLGQVLLGITDPPAPLIS